MCCLFACVIVAEIEQTKDASLGNEVSPPDDELTSSSGGDPLSYKGDNLRMCLQAGERFMNLLLI